MSTWLIGATRDLLAPTWYAMACGAISTASIAVFAIAGRQFPAVTEQVRPV